MSYKAWVGELHEEKRCVFLQLLQAHHPTKPHWHRVRQTLWMNIWSCFVMRVLVLKWVEGNPALLFFRVTGWEDQFLSPGKTPLGAGNGEVDSIVCVKKTEQMLASCGPINLTVKPEEIWVFRQTATFFLKGLTTEGRGMEHFQIFLGHSKDRKRPKDERSRMEQQRGIN